MSGSTFGATRFGDYVEKHGPKQTLVIGARRAADEPFSAPPSAIVFEEVTIECFFFFLLFIVGDVNVVGVDCLLIVSVVGCHVC